MKISKRYYALLIPFLIVSLSAVFAYAETSSEQILSSVDKILKDNPIPKGEKVQMIKLAQTDSLSLFVVRITKDSGVKPHFHKTHDETVNVIKGKGKLLINDAWIDVKPGDIHFNPKGKIHSVKNTGSTPFIIVSEFSPAMIETDRNFVE